MLKDRFSVDNSNRLVIRRGKVKLVPEGRFTVSEDNNLIYWLNEPEPWRRKYSLPGEIKFDGNWKLNSNYDLELALAQNSRQFSGNKIILKGEIFSAGVDGLAFELRSRDSYGRKEFQILKLAGTFRSDPENNIVFSVNKTNDPDTLNLGAGWKLNKNQQIILTYQKESLKTKVKDTRVLTFEGSWDISEKNVLSYILSTSSESRFDFQAQIQTPTIYPQAGKIKYRLGAGIKGGNNKTGKIITLFGAWKFNRALGLIFEINYGRGNIRALVFSADINLTHEDKVILSLVSREREPLGISVTFSHRFLKKLDAEAYFKFKALQENPGIEAGVSIPF